jgi:hypothetical protein
LELSRQCIWHVSFHHDRNSYLLIHLNIPEKTIGIDGFVGEETDLADESG